MKGNYLISVDYMTCQGCATSCPHSSRDVKVALTGDAKSGWLVSFAGVDNAGPYPLRETATGFATGTVGAPQPQVPAIYFTTNCATGVSAMNGIYSPDINACDSSSHTYQFQGAIPRCTNLSLALSPPTWTSVGTSVTGVIQASCPVTPEYLVTARAPDGSTTYLQQWSTSPTFTWNTSGALVGDYTLELHARSVDLANESVLTVPYRVVGRPCQVVGLNISTVGSQFGGTATEGTVGTKFLLSAVAGCDKPSFQFRMLPPGGGRQVLRDYASGSSFVWDTSGVAVGDYQFEVRARAELSPSEYDGSTTSGFTVKANVCGDGVIGAGEECDSVPSAGATCSTRTNEVNPVGTLACTGCSYDASKCTTLAQCITKTHYEVPVTIISYTQNRCSVVSTSSAAGTATVDVAHTDAGWTLTLGGGIDGAGPHAAVQTDSGLAAQDIQLSFECGTRELRLFTTYKPDPCLNYRQTNGMIRLE